MVRIILASQSPRRSEILKQLGVQFEVIPSNFDEDSIEKTNPSAYVKKLAKIKAKTVAKGLDEGIIIGVDTMVSIDGMLIGKPKDKEDAARILRTLSGKVHKVISGVCVINKYSGMTATKSITTKVKFRELDDNVIKWYVGTGDPFGKAGGYGIQSQGALLVEWVRGDYFNVVGLPVVTLAGMLDSMGVKLVE